ncbi:hypothetical protein K402DRAFT_321226 [Aulographum hederae CBS 113979]|uniref:Zn(2)-C6 fungal-type domain-containing protein n=1 Tax=Aulographum hederae CBS 113979 TaxID=1176131 RepID=A0A6G1HGY0_9PEZI|nr:hypothetical protein K402DRAFT_321226 [Aulographum hederae CBS 113979]
MESPVAQNPVPINPRKRSKSRLGCQTCKQKRLKCDETKPFCVNCRNRGLRCPGYEKKLKWSTKYEVFKPANISFSTARKTVPPSPEPPQEDPDQRDSPQDSNEVPVGQAVHVDFNIDPVLLEPVQVSHSLEDEAEPEGVQYTNPLRDYVNNARTLLQDAAPQNISLQSFEDTSLPITENQYEETMLTPLAEEPEPEDQLIEDIIADSSDTFDEVVSPSEWSIGTQQSPNFVNTSQALLQRYYRFSLSPTPRRLTDTSTALVEHYFRDVCVLYSAFDSTLNPFRMTIGRLWDSSPSIFYAIQSMAAAHLGNCIPYMSAIGIQMQHKARESVRSEIQLASVSEDRKVVDRVILTILLLGMTAAWHETGDLGLLYLHAARQLMAPRLLKPQEDQSPENRRNDQFFQEAMIYWEMTMSFITSESDSDPLSLRNSVSLDHYDNANDSILPHLPPQPTSNALTNTKVLPHPWTGIAPRIQLLFAEVGRLVRNERLACMQDAFLNIDLHSSSRLSLAGQLEDELLAVQQLSLESVISPNDPNTSQQDFLTIAEATRCAALLEIYRVFPSILSHRLGVVGGNPFFSDLFSDASNSNPLPNLAGPDFLNALAIHTLTLLESVPTHSGTRFIQLLLILVAAAELRFSPNIPESAQTRDISTLHARAFAEGRLSELSRRLPRKPVERMMQILREVWGRVDGVGMGGDADVFWVDVMLEHGWETVMG